MELGRDPVEDEKLSQLRYQGEQFPQQSEPSTKKLICHSYYLSDYSILARRKSVAKIHKQLVSEL